MIRSFVFFLFFNLWAIFTYAQVDISGVVLDESTGENLVGATIIVGDKGNVTSIDGSFSVKNVDPNEILEVTYIGYETRQLLLAELQTFTQLVIQLKVSTTILDVATITGSKNEKSISRSPVSIGILKPKLADNTNTTRISTLLDKIPGVQVIDNQANIRGGSGWSYGAGSRVLLLIDDIPALQTDAGRPSWGDIPVENIGQVEVLKGAASTLYGSSALNGIVNIRTGYAGSEPVTKFNIGYMQFDDPKDERKKWWTDAPNRLNVGMLHKQKIGKLDFVGNAYYEDYSSIYLNGYEKKFRGSLNLKYSISDRINIGLNSMLNKGEAADHFIWENGSTGIYGGLDGTFSEREFTRYYIDPQITIFDKKENRHKLFGRYYNIVNDNNNGQGNTSVNVYSEYQFFKKIAKLDLAITLGAVASFTGSDSELLLDETVSHDNYAQYIEFDKSFGEDFTLTLGLRHEHHVQTSNLLAEGKDSESKLISRVGLNYKIGEGTFARASWGQGYRYPTIVERFIETAVGGFFIFPNPQLRSEFGWSSEMGIKQGFKIDAFQGYVDLSYFWSQYSDMTEFSLLQSDTGEFGFQSQNVGATDIKGYEFEILGTANFNEVAIDILAGYTFIDPRYQNFENNEIVFSSISKPVGSDVKENILKYRSRRNYKFDIEASYNNFSWGIAGNSASQIETIDELLNNISQIRFYREANPGGFFKFDSRLAYKFRNLKFTLLAENIFNEEYSLRPGLLEAPRSFGFRLDYEL